MMLKPQAFLYKLANFAQRQPVRNAGALQFQETTQKQQSAELKNRMQAWQLHSYGEDLHLSSARIPHINSPSQVLVKVEAASINPIDYAMKDGYGRTMLNLMRGYELEFPLVLGRDFAGKIVDKGLEVDSKYKIGERVYGIVPVHCQGSHAENVLIDESNICHCPEDLLPVEAASVMYTAMTAWSALYISGDFLLFPMKGARVLILGASGGVGTVAVQLLKSQGAYVVGTCSTDAVNLVQSLGADSVYDYKSQDYANNVASEGRYDVVLDCARLGYENLPPIWKYKKFITLNGNLLTNTDKYGLLPGLALSTLNLLAPNASKIPEGKSIRWAFFAPSKSALLFIDKLIRRRKISPTIHKVFKFKEMDKAYETFGAGHLRGKIVVDFT